MIATSCDVCGGDVLQLRCELVKQYLVNDCCSAFGEISYTLFLVLVNMRQWTVVKAPICMHQRDKQTLPSAALSLAYRHWAAMPILNVAGSLYDVEKKCEIIGKILIQINKISFLCPSCLVEY